jgi:hypothetical protein
MGLTKIGALWLKDGKKGKFMSGKIEVEGKEYAILVFKNEKKNDKQPDYNINLRNDNEVEKPKSDYEKPLEENDDLPF